MNYDFFTLVRSSPLDRSHPINAAHPLPVIGQQSDLLAPNTLCRAVAGAALPNLQCSVAIGIMAQNDCKTCARDVVMLRCAVRS